MEATTENAGRKGKTNHGASLEALKREFSKLGDLKRKTKGLKDGVEKAHVRKNHLYDLNAIRKAIKVFKVEVLKDKDVETYRKLLTWERQRLLISVPDEYALNKMEADTLEENCECYNAPPSGLRCHLGGKYKHVSYFDEARQKEMFVTYIPVTIEPEAQIGKKLEWKMKQGFMPEMKDYPEAKILWKRRVLVEQEWNRFFREI
ncbi:MAG: hypothetical protein CL529_12040 [Aequorivita sp.]|nr:hypothetical protein [Aequorivita sp.]|tara:strand:- start:341 stop:952 length:612 start_codon:yes stop_codon:yes gene_type:complete